MGNSTIRDIIIEADDLLTEAICEDDKAEQTRLLAKARRQLADALTTYPEHANLHHMIGLLWYHDPANSEERNQSIEQCFKSAINIESEHQYANLYLGHFYFDTARYAEALSLFTKVDADYFVELDQSWRNLKNAELILCCRMYLNLENIKLSEVEAVCLMYENAGQEDYTGSPTPQEILACVAKLFENQPNKMTPIALRVIELIRRMECDHYKGLQKDLLYLQSALREDGKPFSGCD
jgi:hypothetical protein